ncbi:Vitamin K-dependent gamma-carboxylase [Brevibacterium siliguriense]|uniref:Vitamin K-dependent gamma-carboxylase n=1 Tax=Brevibacterium siliguriense TaxID=1136497 RepID=A0A1H1NPW6_9MICO|nr:HTTM domain-containing protein [Brevibacterium siliguriense]SDS01031.1 Vitamin K-dependent gamma-carboxylase [Brevibacterium siliguriense]
MNSDDTNRKGGNDRDAEVTDQRTGTAASAQESVPEFGLVPVTTLVRTKLSQGWNWLEEMLTGRYHATYGLAVTRILIGFTGLGLILTNFNARHYAFGVGSAWNGEIAEPKSDFPTIWLFSLFHRAVTVPPLFTAMMIGLALLAVVIILGWRTRIVLPVYLVLWVSFIELNDGAGDQGDNAYRMFMIALLFADTTRRWSLDARRRARNPEFPDRDGGQWRWALIMANNLAIVVLAFQVCAIYMSGGLYKAGGEAWQHGFAVYNPLHTQQFGTWPVLSDLMTAWGPMVVAISWGSILFQCAFPFMLFNRYTRIIALLGILSFHLGIALLMGLPWFSLTMIAVDAIFIRDRSFAKVRGYLRHWWKSSAPRSVAGAAGPGASAGGSGARGGSAARRGGSAVDSGAKAGSAARGGGSKGKSAKAGAKTSSGSRKK